MEPRSTLFSLLMYPRIVKASSIYDAMIAVVDREEEGCEQRVVIMKYSL